MSQPVTTPRISILMPVRNAGPFLLECLTSIVRQTETDWELLAVNDHSSDDSLQILEQQAAIDTRIQVLKNEGKGIISALRTAYATSKGSLITRMDADDRMPALKLEKLAQALSKAQPRTVATGLVSYFSEGELGDGFRQYAHWLNTMTLESANFEGIYRECCIPSPCWMMHRQDLDYIGAFEPETYPEDYDLCFRMYAHNFAVAGVGEVLHEWRDHGSRASRNDPNYQDQWFLDLKCSYWKKLDHNPAKPLYIWGAGKKGKRLAAWMEANHIPFRWVTENDNKIGHRIGQTMVEGLQGLSAEKEAQIITAIAGPSDREELERKLTEIGKQVDLKVIRFW